MDKRIERNPNKWCSCNDCKELSSSSFKNLIWRRIYKCNRSNSKFKQRANVTYFSFQIAIHVLFVVVLYNSSSSVWVEKRRKIWNENKKKKKYTSRDGWIKMMMNEFRKRRLRWWTENTFLASLIKQIERGFHDFSSSLHYLFSVLLISSYVHSFVDEIRFMRIASGSTGRNLLLLLHLLITARSRYYLLEA